MTKVWIARALHISLATDAEKYFPLETGGVLVGYMLDDEYVVTHVIGAGPGATHQRSWFEGDHVWQCERLDDIYEATDGVSRYLGDWHTHPEGHAALSRTDKGTLRRIAQHASAALLHPLMLVLAGQPSDWDAAVYVYRGRRLLGMQIRITMAELILYERAA